MLDFLYNYQINRLQVKFSFSFLRNLSYLNMDLKESKELANFYKLGVGRLQVRYKSMEMYQAKILDDITFICHHGSQLDQVFSQV